MLAVSLQLGARPARCVPATPNGCSAEHGTLTQTYTSGSVMFVSRFGLLTPSLGRAEVHIVTDSSSAAHLAKKEAFQRGRWTPPIPGGK